MQVRVGKRIERQSQGRFANFDQAAVLQHVHNALLRGFVAALTERR